ncbi:hypothetical protein TNCV_1719991 [Trichonephila clavipes]|nr:hypothetical protein TNCV_1719991 [Trichonephila clavipes]
MDDHRRLQEDFEIVGAVDTRRYPRAKNRVWSDQKDHEERRSKDRAASTSWTPAVTSFNDTSRRRHSNCSTNNFQTPLQKQILNPSPFPCTPFNTGTSATCVYSGAEARSIWNVTDWQKVVFSDESWFVIL